MQAQKANEERAFANHEHQNNGYGIRKNSMGNAKKFFRPMTAKSGNT